jgi:hypothetical protein
MGILSTKSPSPPDDKTPEITLEDKVRIMQKFGLNLTDEQIAEQIELEQRRALRAINEEKRIEQMAADRVRIEDERKKIALAEIGKKIIVSVNRQRVKGLNADGSIPCQTCGSNFAPATGALLEIAEVVRVNKDLHALVGRLRGVKPQGLPCVAGGGKCPHCGTGASYLIQLVI